MQLISPIDSIMLLAESREHPMHVAGLQLFEPPPGAGPEFVRDIYQAMLAHQDVQSTFRKRPARLVGGISSLTWSLDDDVDLEYHVRRSALPAPGRVRELLELTSRLHGSLLNRHRPLWEMHVIEGLEDGRFAVYTKMHHALVDGVSALNLLQRSLSSGPSDAQIRVPWELPPNVHGRKKEVGRLRRVLRTAESVAGLGPSALALAHSGLLQQQLTLPFRAPRTMLNVPIGGARRCAAQSWSLERIKNVKNAAGVTVNDVVLAMCAGALRGYLSDQNALPDAPLIAMVPVSLRTEDDADGGNVVAGVLCNLATHLGDPAKRLATIQKSMQDNKKVLSQLPRAQAMALSATTISHRPRWPASPALPRPLRRRSTSASRTCPECVNRCTGTVPGWRATIRCRSSWMGKRSISRWRPAPTALTSGSSGAAARYLTSSGCSVISKRRSLSWNTQLDCQRLVASPG
jgi:WS/DGAT/MGAT family acyltransferase